MRPRCKRGTRHPLHHAPAPPAHPTWSGNDLDVAANDVDDDDVDEFNPNDWASLMHKAIKQPDEDGGVVPAALANAGLSDAANARVFGADPSTWEGAGLPDVFVAHLRDPKTGYKNPTRVQQLSVPHILRGDDVLIRAETGSGKTLAYMCPILAALAAPCCRKPWMWRGQVNF